MLSHVCGPQFRADRISEFRARDRVKFRGSPRQITVNTAVDG